MINGHPFTAGLGASLAFARAIAVVLGAVVFAGWSTGAEPRRLQRASEFWLMPDAEKSLRWEVDFELTVLYFDPHWNLLWGVGDIPVYLPMVAGRAPVLRSGQRVRLEGAVVPAEGFTREGLRVTVLGEEAWPAPRAIAGDLVTDDALNVQWVELSGPVVAQLENDPLHIEYHVMVDGHLVVGRLQVDPGEPLPQLLEQRVRLRGAHVTTRDPSGKFLRAELWVPRRRDITVLGPVADDPRLALPATAIEDLGPGKPAEWVKVVGTVFARDDQELTVRDGTGQLTIATAQTGRIAPGATVEVVGRPVLGDGGITLAAPFWREVSTTLIPPRALQKLRLAAQILELDAAEADKGHPVVLAGVVTWSHPSAPFFFIEDASGGVRVTGGLGGAPPAPAAAIRVEGRTAMGAYAPEVRVANVALIGHLAVTVPRTVAPEQLLSGEEECRRVALLGLVRAVKPEGPWQRVELVAATGEFVAQVPAGVDLEDLVGTVVRVTGVCAGQADEQGRLVGSQLWVPDRSGFELREAAPADAFDRPVEAVVDLQRFSGRRTAMSFARVRALVTSVQDGSFFVQDGPAGLKVLPRTGPLPAVGSPVEVVGLLGREGRRIVMREGHWRAGPESLAHPVVLDLANLDQLHPEAETALVRVSARLEDVRVRGRETTLLLQTGDRNFDAMLPGTGSWLPGSTLALTGVYLLEYDENGRSRGFSLRLRSPADVAVVRKPSWWTAGRLGAGLAAVGLVGLAALAWVGVLRRQVARQTAQIRAHWEREARMQSELERSTRLESLGVLAGGIAHDFNNLLTAILGNLGLVALDRNAMSTSGKLIENARQATRRAGEITQQLLTFARGGDPIRTAVSLGDLAREAAGFALHGSKVRAEFDLPAETAAAAIDAAQMTRVIHNLVLNAVQAMPGGGTVRMALREVVVAAAEVPGLVPGRYLRLAVADTGPGIPAKDLPRLFEPYFSTKQGNTGLGLAVVRSIVQKHDGAVTVESEPGRGTVFTLWLPVAAEVPVARPEPAPPAAPTPRRVLLMDDEDLIRDTAQLALTASGHEPTVVADGAAAVRAFAEARTAGRPFDVVILDLTVPGGMGGEETVREILRLDPAARVIVSSGYSSNPVMARYRDYGFCAVVPKPYELSGLLRAVEFAANPG